MKSKETLNKIKTFLGMEIKFEQMILKDGAILEAESFESGSEVFIIVEEEKIPAPVGEHELEDGSMLVIEEEGIIKEITKEEPAEEEVVVEEELEEEVKVEEEELEEEEEEVKYVTLDVFEESMKEMKEMIMTYIEDKEKEEMKEKEEFSKEVKPLNHSPESKIVKKEVSSFSKNRKLTTNDRVTNQIYNIKK